MNKTTFSKNSSPVEKSYISRHYLDRKLEAGFGLSDVHCQLISATMRDVYHVRSKGKQHIFYLYRYDQRTFEEIDSEWDFVDFLHQADIPVAPSIRRTDRGRILTFQMPEGERYGVLTTFVEGKHLRQKPDVGAARRYGRLIAQIHALADVLPFELIRPANEAEFLLDRMLDALNRELHEQSEVIDYLREADAILRPRMEALSREKPIYGIIHGDVIRANAQVSSDGTVTILDFDLCGSGWRAYDIATYQVVLKGQVNEMEFKAAFLDGYQEVRPLTDPEIKSLPLLEAVRHFVEIGIPAMNVYHWGRSGLSDYWVHQAVDGIRYYLKELG